MGPEVSLSPLERPRLRSLRGAEQGYRSRPRTPTASHGLPLETAALAGPPGSTTPQAGEVWEAWVRVPLVGVSRGSRKRVKGSMTKLLFRFPLSPLNLTLT